MAISLISTSYLLLVAFSHTELGKLLGHARNYYLMARAVVRSGDWFVGTQVPISKVKSVEIAWKVRPVGASSVYRIRLTTMGARY